MIDLGVFSYDEFDVIDAVNRLEYQMNIGYLDIGGTRDEVEVEVIKEAIKLFKENYNLN